MAQVDILRSLYRNKLTSFIDSQLELLNLKILYPERFPSPTSQQFHSNLYIVPKPQVLTLVGLAEIVVAISLICDVVGPSGQSAFRTDIARAFEWMFNFSFGDIYEKKSAVFRRKAFNQTKALDSLRTAIQRENRRRNGLVKM